MFDSVDIVGNRFLKLESVVELLKIEEEKDDLFANFPIGATIQDGGKRKRSDVYASNVNTAFLYEVSLISIVQENNNLLFRQALSSHVDLWFELAIAFDHTLNVINVLHLENREGFLDFKNVFGIITYLKGLCI